MYLIDHVHGGEYKNLKEVIYQGLGKTDPISKKKIRVSQLQIL